MKRQYLLIIIVAVTIGFLAQFQWIGSLLIAAYGAISLWKRLPSKVAFQLAILSLILVPLAIVTGRWAVAQNFGAYSFLLFVVALILVTAELRRTVTIK